MTDFRTDDDAALLEYHLEEMAEYSHKRKESLACIEPLRVSALRMLHVKFFGDKKLAAGMCRETLIEEIVDATMGGPT